MSVYLDALDFAHLMALQQRELAQLDERMDGYRSRGLGESPRLLREYEQCTARVERLKRTAAHLAAKGYTP